MTDTIEGTAVEERDQPGSDLVARQAPSSLAVTPQVQAAELVERLNVIREAAERAMQEGVDFGRIPGVDKPTLFKPGAEKLGVLFQLDIQLENEKLWGPGDHLTVISRATVFHAPTGARLGFGEGVCSTRERKYAYRRRERVCPSCGQPAVIKGKQEFGGGWVCWKKRGGCGANFAAGDPQVESQEVGEIENPDLPDTWNTVVKMSEKRARVDAVLAVTGASALFTQDAEDLAGPDAAAATVEPGGSAPGRGVGGTISKEQQKLLFAKARECGVDDGRLRELMHQVCGVASSYLVPQGKLDELLAAVDADSIPFE